MTKTQVAWDFIQSSKGELYAMQKHTWTILMLMTGLLSGRLVSFHDIAVIEVAGLAMLILCHGSEIWNGINRFATRPAVRTYVAPRASRVNGLVLSSGLPQK